MRTIAQSSVSAHTHICLFDRPAWPYSVVDSQCEQCGGGSWVTSPRYYSICLINAFSRSPSPCLRSACPPPVSASCCVPHLYLICLQFRCLLVLCQAFSFFFYLLSFFFRRLSYVKRYPFLATGLCSGCGGLSSHHPVWTSAESTAAQWHRTHLLAGWYINTHPYLMWHRHKNYTRGSCSANFKAKQIL